MESIDVLEPVFEDAGHFGFALLDYAERMVARMQPIWFRLPSLHLHLSCDDATYLADCRRALIDDPVYEGPATRVVVLSRPDDAGLPALAPAVAALGLGKLFQQFEAAGLRGSYDFDHRVWQVYDPARRFGVQVALDGRYTPWETSFPLRNFLHWHYEELGMRLVHGATLGVDGVGVLLCGEGGAGKSGTTLGGMMHGLQSVGDDYVLLDLSGDRPRALPVMRLMKQDKAGLDRLGFDLGRSKAVGPNWQDKYELDLGDQPAGSRVSELALAAILLPRLGGGERSTVAPATSREAMLAFAPSTLRQLPGRHATGLAFMADLVRRVPTLRLSLSSDAAEIAATIRRVLSEVAS